MILFGGLPRMATEKASDSMNVTIRHEFTELTAGENSSSAPARKSFSAHGRATPISSGENSLTIVDRMESVAPSSETNHLTKVLNSFDRRIELLTVSGLIAGTIPMSMRQKSDHGILAIASSRPDGDDAA